MTRHQYGISVLVSQTSFGGETSGRVAKCRLFSQATYKATFNRVQTFFFSIYLLIITLNNYIYNTTEKKHFNNSIAMALAMRKAGKDATAKKQHYKVERS